MPNQTINQSPPSLQQGMIWNLASLGFLALAGLFLNFAIARFYGQTALGVFNMAFAIYIFASQFGAFGIHMSLLESISKFCDHMSEDLSKCVNSGIFILAITSLAVALFGFALIPLASAIYQEKAPGLDKAILVILPALWAFSINKGLLSIINGVRHMRMFASMMALRYILLLLAFAAFAFFDVKQEYLAGIFSISELILLPLLLIYVRRITSLGFRNISKAHCHRHLWFGTRVFLSGAVLELNTRVDILMIGFFLDAKAAGMYSIAALIAEGAGQAVFAIRNNFNPLIANFIAQGNTSKILALSRKSTLLLTPFMAIVSGVAFLLFPMFCTIVLGDESYLQARTALIILLGGITLSSGLMAFNMLFNQAGKPATHTMFVFAILLVNIVLNALLIPVFAINGAALATSLSFVISVVILIVIARKFLKIRLLF